MSDYRDQWQKQPPSDNGENGWQRSEEQSNGWQRPEDQQSGWQRPDDQQSGWQRPDDQQSGWQPPDNGQSTWQRDSSQQSGWYGNNQQTWNQQTWQQGNRGWQQPPYQQGGYPPNGYYQMPPEQPNTLAKASLFVALLALISCCCSPLVQFPLAVGAIVLVILSKKGRPFNGFAVAGLVLAIIAILISIAMTLMIGLMRSPAYQNILNSPEFQQMYEEIYESMYGTN